MKQSDQINELAKALSAAQATIRNAPMDAENPHFRAKYATLAAILNEIREPFGRNGLALSQVPQISETGIILTTRIMHISGQFIEGDYPVDPIKKDPQGYGSALTYARRYSLSAMVGIAGEEDDDGAAAIGRPGTQANQTQRQPRQDYQQSARKSCDQPQNGTLAPAEKNTPELLETMYGIVKAKKKEGIKEVFSVLYGALISVTDDTTATAIYQEVMGKNGVESCEQFPSLKPAQIAVSQFYSRVIAVDGGEDAIRSTFAELNGKAA